MMKLYGGLASPYVARVAMQATLKGIELPIVDAPGGLNSEQYRAITPIGKIPALEIDGQVITESEVICEFLEDRFPEKPLLPADPFDRARSRMISRMVDLYIAPHNSPLRFMRDPAQRDPAVVDNAAALYAKGFSCVEHFMTGPLCVGDKPTLADCALLPFIIMLKTNVFSVFEEITDPTTADGKLAEWWQAAQQHPEIADFIKTYQQAFDKFMLYLQTMLAQRGG